MSSAIIIPAFTRAYPLKRLLDSLASSELNPEVKIIISLDGGYSNDVECLADHFQMSDIEVLVIKHDLNLGLRQHILWCGDQTEAFDEVIVLEDDLIVDKFFFNFAIQASKFYRDDNRVAGIALYSPSFNEYSMEQFFPIHNGTSCYFMQIPCSWGQLWTKNQWRNFKSWYVNGDESKVTENDFIPSSVKSWPNTSWKKFYCAYLQQTNKYFLYPYLSYTSNCADIGGTHIPNGTNIFQVPLPDRFRLQESFTFISLDDTSVQYDTFFEISPKYFNDELGEYGKDVEIDFYGTKPISLLIKKRYALTSKRSLNSIKTYPDRYLPRPFNVFYSEELGDKYAYNLALSADVFIPHQPAPLEDETQVKDSMFRRILGKLKSTLKRLF